MQLRWILEHADGRVTVLASGRLKDLAREGYPDADAVRTLVLGKDVPADVVRVTEMPAGWEPPTDRRFRNAWRATGRATEGAMHPECDRIEVEMPHARQVHRDRLRRKRLTRLAELDRDYLRADEDGDQAAKARIVAEKRRLRDLPADPRIEAARTPDDLWRVQVTP